MITIDEAVDVMMEKRIVYYVRDPCHIYFSQVRIDSLFIDGNNRISAKFYYIVDGKEEGLDCSILKWLFISNKDVFLFFRDVVYRAIKNIEEEDDQETHLNVLSDEACAKDIEHYMAIKYPICVYFIDDEDGGYWIAYHPDFGESACSAIGVTAHEAVSDLHGVRRDVIMYYLEDGMDIPKRSKGNLFEK